MYIQSVCCPPFYNNFDPKMHVSALTPTWELGTLISMGVPKQAKPINNSDMNVYLFT